MSARDGDQTTQSATSAAGMVPENHSHSHASRDEAHPQRYSFACRLVELRGNGISSLTRFLCTSLGRDAGARPAPRRVLILLTAALSLARAADLQPYRVELAPTGNKALDSTLKATSQLLALR